MRGRLQRRAAGTDGCRCRGRARAPAISSRGSDDRRRFNSAILAKARSRRSRSSSAISSASRPTTARASINRTASRRGVTTIPNAGQINALLDAESAAGDARKTWGFDDRKARSMTDADDDDPSMPDALEIAAAAGREARRRPASSSVRCTASSSRSRISTTPSTCARRPALMRFYANDRPPDDATFVARLRAAGRDHSRESESRRVCERRRAQLVRRHVLQSVRHRAFSPSNSSAGSGSSVAANLVTCAIAEETGSSIRGPARANNAVGIAPTQELISRDGMIQPGINTRVGPICRTCRGCGAQCSTAYAGYDPKDELTVFSVGRNAADSRTRRLRPRSGSTACGSASCASCSTRPMLNGRLTSDRRPDRQGARSIS